MISAFPGGSFRGNRPETPLSMRGQELGRWKSRSFWFEKGQHHVRGEAGAGRQGKEIREAGSSVGSCCLLLELFKSFFIYYLGFFPTPSRSTCLWPALELIMDLRGPRCPPVQKWGGRQSSTTGNSFRDASNYFFKVVSPK